MTATPETIQLALKAIEAQPSPDAFAILRDHKDDPVGFMLIWDRPGEPNAVKLDLITENPHNTVLVQGNWVMFASLGQIMILEGGEMQQIGLGGHHRLAFPAFAYKGDEHHLRDKDGRYMPVDQLTDALKAALSAQPNLAQAANPA